VKLIKLNAIDSTNDFIKKIKSLVDDKLFFVFTYNQTKGRGQMNKVWESQPNKNICFSICYKPIKSNPKQMSFKLNMLISLILLDFFKELKIPDIKIKWPNDILSAEKKISGILIESSIKSNNINDYIIGIGLNINQESFNGIINANSVKNILGINYDLNLLSNRLFKLFSNLDRKIEQLSIKYLKKKYLENLYGLDSLLKFSNYNGKFKAKIIEVISENKIKLLVDNKELIFDSDDLKLHI
tara:strand:- start:3312 stop:4037 length:726 start_codon:yes stop_codon:yes gene_type:complete